MTATAGGHGHHAVWWRARCAGLLVMAMATGTFAQFALGALAPLLSTDLGLTRARLGALTTAFFVVSALMSPVIGTLTDRYGGRRVLIWLFGSASVAYLWMGVSPSYWHLMAASALAGVAGAAANPATNHLIMSHAPSGRRGRVTGIKQSGVWLGAAVAGSALPPAAGILGWRPVLGITAVVGIAGALVSVRFLPTAPPPPETSASGDRSPHGPGGCLCMPSSWVLVLRWSAPTWPCTPMSSSGIRRCGRGICWGYSGS